MRNIVLYLLFFVVMVVPQQTAGEGNRLVKVGILEVEPIVFTGENGKPQGLFIDVVEQVAALEGWNLQYVHGSWFEGFNRMRNQEINLLTSVSYTPARDEYLDYCDESVITLWGQVFVKEATALQTILDLKDQRVALMKGDINGKNFLETIEKFEISCQPIEFSTLEEVFVAVEKGEVVAGVAPNIFGYRYAGRHGLVGTAIIFSPVSVYFATAAGTNQDLLDGIDRHLQPWKKDKGSFYYRRLEHWFGGEQFEKPIPAWIFTSLGIILLAVFALAFWSRILKKSVAEKTSELRQSQADYKQLVENSNSIILRWDVNGLVTFLNEFGQQFFGYSLDEIIGMNVVGTIVPESDKSGKDLTVMIQEILKSPSDYLLNENENMCRDGRRVRVQWSNKPIVDEQGELLEILSVGFDITKLSRIEREKRENEHRYRVLFESASDAILILREGLFWDCNSKTLDIFGSTMSQILANSPADFSPEEQLGGHSSIAEAQARIDAALAGENQFFPWVFKRYDGSLFDAEVSLNRIDFGDDTYLQVIVRDVSERVRLEGELRQIQKVEAIGNLAGGIAHDFNNILTAILGFAGLAQFHKDSPDKLKRDLQEVEKAAIRAKDLVEQILTYSRKSEQEKQPLQVSLVLKEALKLLRSSIPSTIEMHDDIRSDALVSADPIQIHQVIMNLCTNAYQAMRIHGGSLTVSLDEIDLMPDNGIPALELMTGRYLVMKVSDTGPGMMTEILDKIFEPYFTTKEVGEGTGLGLALVHGIVKSHHGGIHVRSEVGRGTVFTIYLPIAEDEVEEAPESAEQEVGEGKGSGHIMLVDDEPNILDVGSEVLKAFGYQVTTFADPVQALEAYVKESQSYDLLVTDMTMPGMTGAELAIKILELRSDFPIIICTGYSELINRESALALGVQAYFQKPVMMTELAKRIKALICP